MRKERERAQSALKDLPTEEIVKAEAKLQEARAEHRLNFGLLNQAWNVRDHRRHQRTSTHSRRKAWTSCLEANTQAKCSNFQVIIIKVREKIWMKMTIEMFKFEKEQT